jgi:hypothetical protein
MSMTAGIVIESEIFDGYRAKRTMMRMRMKVESWPCAPGK